MVVHKKFQKLIVLHWFRKFGNCLRKLLQKGVLCVPAAAHHLFFLHVLKEMCSCRLPGAYLQKRDPGYEYPVSVEVPKPQRAEIQAYFCP